MNLVKKLALTLAITSTITLTSCAYNESFQNLTSTVASTSSAGITDVVFVYPETSKQNYYISVIGHFDSGEEIQSGWKTTRLASYNNHKDYRITYSVSKEDFAKISFLSNKSIEIISLTSEQRLNLAEIISNYTAIEVVDLGVEDKDLHKTLGSFSRFDEEKYLMS